MVHRNDRELVEIGRMSQGLLESELLTSVNTTSVFREGIARPARYGPES